MGIGVALVLGLSSIIGTLVGGYVNNKNNQFMQEMNEDNQQFMQETNEQNHQWSLEAAQWEYEHTKPQTQYANLIDAGLTPAAAAQKLSGANVSYSPATAVAPQNSPKSMNSFGDSLQQVIGQIGDFANMEQSLASAEKTKAETKVINQTAIDKASVEIDKILADTLKTYSDIEVNDSQIDVNDSQIEVNDANALLNSERVGTEQVNRRAIELSNLEKKIQLQFTRQTLEMSLQKTEAEIKLLAEQTAKLQGEVDSVDFENKYKEWRNTYIDTYGVAPEQSWQNMLFKAMADGKGNVMLDSLSQSLRLIFSDDNPYRFENEQYMKQKEADGKVYHSYYFGNRRLSTLERWRNGFFRP